MYWINVIPGFNVILLLKLNKVKIEAQRTRTLKHKPSSLSDMYLHIYKKVCMSLFAYNCAAVKND